MPVRGVRGAITIDEDLPEFVLSATRELLLAILEANPELDPGDLASAMFTVTDDITSVYPAEAARQLGWTHVPLMCGREIPVDGSIPLCVRALLHWNTNKPQTEIHHIYLRNAANLRPDLTVSERLK